MKCQRITSQLRQRFKFHSLLLFLGDEMLYTLSGRNHLYEEQQKLQRTATNFSMWLGDMNKSECSSVNRPGGSIFAQLHLSIKKSNSRATITKSPRLQKGRGCLTYTNPIELLYRKNGCSGSEWNTTVPMLLLLWNVSLFMLYESEQMCWQVCFRNSETCKLEIVCEFNERKWALFCSNAYG